MKRIEFRKTAHILLITALLTVFLLCALSMKLYAKYITSFDTQYFSLHTEANYKVTFYANGGSLRYPASAGGRWIGLDDKKAIKSVEYGNAIGWNGIDNTDFPGDTASDANAPVRDGYDFDGWGASLLPSDYEELKYITSNGNQYIDTGVKFTSSNASIDIKFTMNQTTTQTCMTGCEMSGKPWNFIAQFNAQGLGMYHNELQGWNRTALEIGKVYELNMSQSGNTFSETLNGVTHTTTSTFKLVDNTYALFADNTVNLGYNQRAYVSVYSCVIRQNGEILRNFIPCYSRIEKCAGLYDTVYKDFYPSETATPFIKGPAADESGATEGRVHPDTVIDKYEDRLVYAQWIPHSHTVTLNANDTTGSTRAEGNVPEGKITIIYGRTYSNLPTLTRKGYNFDGWYDAISGGNKYAKEDTVELDEDAEFFAHWTPHDIKVTLEGNGGTVPSPSVRTVKFDDPYGTLPEMTRTGYTFEGWYMSQIPTDYLEATHITSNGKQYIDTGYEFPADAEEIKIEMKFSPLSLSGTTVIAGSEVGTSPWNFIPQFQNNGLGMYHNYLNGYERKPVSIGTDYELTMTQSGNIFSRTINGDTKSTESEFTPSGRTYALFADHVAPTTNFNQMCSIKMYYCKIYINGKIVKDYVPCVKAGTEIAGLFERVDGDFYPSATSTGFGHGETLAPSGEPITAETNVTVDYNHTLYARWTALESTITFDKNDETGSTRATGELPEDGIKVTYDSEYPELPELMRTGYEFLGWFVAGSDQQIKKGDKVDILSDTKLEAGWKLDPDGTDVDFEDCQTVKNLCENDGDNLDLYEVWKKIITMHLLSPEDGIDRFININEGEEIYEAGMKLERSGQDFLGWYGNDGAKYFDEEGEFCHVYPAKNIIVKPRFLSHEYLYAKGITFKDYATIDTGFAQNWNKNFTIEIKFSYATSGRRYLLIGNYPTNNNLNIELTTGNKFRVYCDASPDSTYSDIQVPIGCENTMTFSYDSSAKQFTACMDDGEGGHYVKTGTPNKTGPVIDSLWIGQADRRGSNTFSPITVYSVKIYEDGYFIRDLRPAQKIDGETGGMVDVENNEAFYTNDNGTVELIWDEPALTLNMNYEGGKTTIIKSQE